MNRGIWADDEHDRLLEGASRRVRTETYRRGPPPFVGIAKYGHSWEAVARHIGTRSRSQTRSHAEKFFKKQRLRAAEVGATSPAPDAPAYAPVSPEEAPGGDSPPPAPSLRRGGKVAPPRSALKRPAARDDGSPVSAAKPRKVAFALD